MMLQRRSIILTAMLALAVAACGDDEGPTTTVRGTGRPLPPPEPTTATGGGAKPGTPGGGGAPGTTTGSTDEQGAFTYKPGRDPFQSYFDITGEQQEVAKLEPLQKHDLSKLKIVAIVTGTVQPAAMIIDPEGKNHIIKRGSLLGPPRGRVARILSDRVVVEREYKDRLERIHKLVHELKIRPEEEESREAQR